MNIINDFCPESVEISGHLFYINSDFKTCYKIALLIEKEITSESIIDILTTFYKNPEQLPTDSIEHLKYAIKFVLCTLDKEDTSDKKQAKGKTKNIQEKLQEPPVISYNEDAKYIYSAFRQIYGINLAKDELNWWEFRALFDGLPNTTKLSQVINIRTMELPTGSGNEKLKSEIIEAKEAFALKGNDGIKQKMAANTFEMFRPKGV